ncbi:ABC transporter substrate-binding protein [Bradyrhizobium sp. 131]|uniref:ABC transporter substrate-binding protein n=1 Tax=Bradyrhizobium sp. 131 TaxID=2782609 RepID=UPI00205AB5F1|nr:ABC transporter substrate-binding protein [Bradyrhizobium sp. 131]UPK20542.1 ABC transporter substrate-binding protein [Bradyrhizobium sp. 131]
MKQSFRCPLTDPRQSVILQSGPSPGGNRMQFDQLKRRDFITLLGGGTVVQTMLWPLSTRAQQHGRKRRVGVLLAYAEGDREAQRRIVAFQQSLHGLGWTDGDNIHVDYRFSAGDPNRTRTYAAEIASLAPDVIVAESTPVLSVVQTETYSIPIVFVLISDPVGQRLVQSLARPGGNMTGFAGTEPTMGGKLLELLKEIAPSVKRVAVLFNPKTAPYVTKYLSVINAVSASFAVEAIAMPIKDANRHRTRHRILWARAERRTSVPWGHYHNCS